MNPRISLTSPLPLLVCCAPTSCVTLTLTSHNADYTGSLTQCLWSHSSAGSDRSGGRENEVAQPKRSKSSLLLVVEGQVSAVRLESCTGLWCLVLCALVAECRTFILLVSNVELDLWSEFSGLGHRRDVHLTFTIYTQPTGSV